jgi:hypothetical protein
MIPHQNLKRANFNCSADIFHYCNENSQEITNEKLNQKTLRFNIHANEKVQICLRLQQILMSILKL